MTKTGTVVYVCILHRPFKPHIASSCQCFFLHWINHSANRKVQVGSKILLVFVSYHISFTARRLFSLLSLFCQFCFVSARPACSLVHWTCLKSREPFVFVLSVLFCFGHAGLFVGSLDLFKFTLSLKEISTGGDRDPMRLGGWGVGEGWRGGE